MLDESMIFDLGPGSVRNFRASDADPERISRIFISHTHADHISDLIPFLWMVQIDGRQKPLEVYGPPGFKETFRKLKECTSTAEDFFKFPLTVSELNFGDRLGNVQTAQASHSVPTVAFRVEADGSSFCYSADTTYARSVISLAKEAKLLIHEATFLEDQRSIANLTYHSTARMAGQVAKEANVEALALFHIPPPNEHREKEIRRDASAAYGKDVIVGADLISIEF